MVARELFEYSDALTRYRTVKKEYIPYIRDNDV